ncbi:MAG: chalcone isomerase family protein [Burkholderiaceae bacterium]|nr:chalcone isomerase family protein [Burkholderiaceae bacterium]
MLKKVLIALSSALVMGQACAGNVMIESIEYTKSVTIEQEKLVLNGAGLRKVVFFKVYAAGLYIPKAVNTTKAVLEQTGPARVRLGLLRDVSAADFVEALEDGLKDNTSDEDRKAIETQVTALIAVMKKIGDVKVGDLIDFEYSPKAGTSVTMNGKVVGANLGAKPLFDAVLRIWLGDRCIDESLKEAMLKAKNTD